MLDHAVKWCNSLNRTEAKLVRATKLACQRHGIESTAYDDAVIALVALRISRDERRERLAERCAPWFEVAQ